MKRLLIAMAVVAGMSIATSSAMAHGPYRGGPPRGMYRPPMHVDVHRYHYRHAPVRYYGGPRVHYAPVYPIYHVPPPMYYHPGPAMGIHTRGFSFGIGF